MHFDEAASLAHAGGFPESEVWNQVATFRKPTFQELANEIELYAVACVSAAGVVRYYTGKAGDGYLTLNLEEAFPYQTLEGAERKVDAFQKFNTQNLIWFVFDPKVEG
jgi:hypothetical protein